jgi:hypothetical protein
VESEEEHTLFRSCDDDGFSLIEVAFAAFIAFFIITALFALLVASTGMGKYAGRIVASNNLATQLIDDARSLDYTSLGVVGATGNQVEGSLLPSETVTFQAASYIINRDVTWVDDPSNGANTPYDYKKFVLKISYNGGGSWLSYTTYIRDPSSTLTKAPTVVWWTGMPLNNAWITGYLWLGANADATGTAGTITTFDYYQDGDAIAGAHWTTGGYHWFLLDSTQLAEGHTYEYKVIVSASGGGFAQKLRSLSVDNYAPTWTDTSVSLASIPGTNGATYYSPRALRLHWTPPQDGTHNDGSPFYVTSYDFYSAVNTNLLTSYATSTSALGLSGDATVTSTTFAGYAVSPFNVYAAKLYGRSPLGNHGSGSSVSTYVVTLPVMEATATIPNSNLPTTMTISFGVGGPPANYLTLMGGNTWHYRVVGSSSYTAGQPLVGTSVVDYAAVAPPTAAQLTSTVKSNQTFTYYQMLVWASLGTNQVGPVLYSEVIQSPSWTKNKTYKTPHLASGGFTIP